jgi:hypothetical protein
VKRYALYGLLGAAGFAAYRLVKVWPSYRGTPVLAFENALNPLNPGLWAAAAGGVIAALVTK